MKTISEYPGAFGFRLVVMVGTILAFLLAFLYYLDESAKVIEQKSVLQTRKIVESSLLVVFSKLAIRGELNRLNDLASDNPFDFLREFDLTPANYRGEIDEINGKELNSGWYFVNHNKLIMYKPVYEENISYFTIALDYDDLDNDGIFVSQNDKFRRLYIKTLPRG